MPKVDQLTAEQGEQVIRFLLHRMTQDTRHALMRSLPMAYAAMYSGTDRAVILAVRAGLGDIQEG